jgi:dTDP-4-dehydrorhamnose 3,5-epimerase
VILEPTPLAGLMLVQPDKHHDQRGFFARVWCRDTAAAAGMAFDPVQISVSFNHRAGTLRGLHWQAPPHGESKLVRATRGRVFDVAVDLRPGSPTRCCWHTIELGADSHLALFIPPGFAHGFLTLEDDSEVLYATDTPHEPASSRGARYDDPAFAIRWPGPPAVIAERDCLWPPFDAVGGGA